MISKEVVSSPPQLVLHGFRPLLIGHLKNRSDVQCIWRYNFLAKKAAVAGTEVQPLSPLTAVQVAPDEVYASN
jgi:hypothetical protein